MHKGSLVVVGTGIQCPSHLTLEAKSYIEGAEKVFYLVTEPIAAQYIKLLNHKAEDLYKYYSLGKPRIDTYNKMVKRILSEVKKGRRVCAAFYGHPGIFVYPSHVSIKIARQQGYPAVMLPAPSAEDSLFADLGLDPGMGCQSYEATGFLLGKVNVNTSAILILWQIGTVGDQAFNPSNAKLAKRLDVLSQYLQKYYSDDHPAIVYEASAYPICKPRIETLKLKDLSKIAVTGVSTLCIPPIQGRASDDEMIELLGMNKHHLKITAERAYRPTEKRALGRRAVGESEDKRTGDGHKAGKSKKRPTATTAL